MDITNYFQFWCWYCNKENILSEDELKQYDCTITDSIHEGFLDIEITCPKCKRRGMYHRPAPLYTTSKLGRRY